MPKPGIILERLESPEGIKAMSCFDLSFMTLMASYDKEPAKAEKDAVHAVVLAALDNHWCNMDILSAVASGIQTGGLPPAKCLDALAREINTSTGRNLVDTKRVYYHKFMLLMPPPATILWDDNAGTFEIRQEPYYCENKCELTISDICGYFIQRSREAYGERANRYAQNYIIGILKNWVTEQWFDADLILFAIDDAINSREYIPIRHFADLREHLFQAGETLKGKSETIMSSTMEGGGPFVIPRHRELVY